MRVINGYGRKIGKAAPVRYLYVYDGWYKDKNVVCIC
jgi:hypothetical protein